MRKRADVLLAQQPALAPPLRAEALHPRMVEDALRPENRVGRIAMVDPVCGVGRAVNSLIFSPPAALLTVL